MEVEVLRTSTNTKVANRTIISFIQEAIEMKDIQIKLKMSMKMKWRTINMTMIMDHR